MLESENTEELVNNLFFDYSEIKTFLDLEKGYTNYDFFKKSFNRIYKLFTNNDFFVQPSRKELLKSFFNSNFLVPKEEKEKIYNSLFKFVENEKKSNKNNLSIIMKVHLYRHSIRGAFESLHGQVKAYSIYHPYIYEYSKTWPVSYLENRSIMEEFLLYKYPDLAKIPLQSYDMPINYRFKKVNLFMKVLLKFRSLINFVFRGLSIDYNSWWHQREMKNLIEKSFVEKNVFFDSLFDRNQVHRILNSDRYTLQAEHLLKLKLMFDIIEKKEYDKLIDLDIEEVDKY